MFAELFQAFDTATHALLVRDMVRWDEETAGTELGLRRTLIVVAIVWAVHAIANLVSPTQSGYSTWFSAV